MSESRMERIKRRAQRLFASAPAYAEEWLRTPQAQLGERAPLQMLKDEDGAREVEEILLSIEHGFFA